MMESTNDEQLRNLAHNITILRLRAGKTKRAMAKLLHTSVHTINRLETGEVPSRLSAEVLFNAGQYFCIPVHRLLEKRL